ncbi:hypothetical protein AUC68_04735 [Methyloceanibacter methanicus]|uniref:Uncharacterized protein n=1 Tax=Methyloceanibacter methanicus TaxID=1774968 RepID=A0A1E3W0G9_9HYPH|nr:hypothetical protein [Methyloceanibacter methanicus]ODR99304.1 hypothetical protein AUC68_04735 [Methyloceanibacter methanicus]
MVTMAMIAAAMADGDDDHDLGGGNFGTRLQAAHVIDGALRVSGNGEDGAFIVAWRPQMTSRVLRDGIPMTGRD